MQSLIKSHTATNASTKLHFDLIQSEGLCRKGVIILLHGVPGVGKTSTAECAAEANKRPLLPITCGDLSTSTKEVETRLQNAFQLAQLWNCVLLLDEADIFLAHRNENDIERNALVSSILFLTTNRVGIFDEAFKSRLHIPLYYPLLEWRHTKRIWEAHLNKLAKSGLIEVDRGEILNYAETFFENQSKPKSRIGPIWNGRQIRNAFQSAVALAAFKQGSTHKIILTRDHFEKVASVSNAFNSYLWSIQCKTDSDRALQWGYWQDSWEDHYINGGTAGPNTRIARTHSTDVMMMGFGAGSPIAVPSMAMPRQLIATGGSPANIFNQPGALMESGVQGGPNRQGLFFQQQYLQPQM